MDKIEKSLKKLQKVQKKLEKRKKKLNRVAQAQMMTVAANSELKKLNASAQTILKDEKTMKLGKKIGIGLLCLGAVVLIVKVLRDRRSGEVVEDWTLPEQGIVEESKNNIDTASLEELENALLRVENELNEVNAALEKKKN